MILQFCHPYTHKIPYGVIEFSKKKKYLINEKPKMKYLVNSGIYCIEPKAFKIFSKQ